ncbi:MAG TPA: type II secretion system protein GspI, partial [Armatimonadetes bacterium]|nr:type II secretion system protein GspI [Armatimonadota bacterium]
MRRARGRLGFTLLEVLVALAVLGIGLTGVLQLVAQSQRQAADDRARASALRLAESRLNEVVLDPELTTGEEQGQFEGEDQAYRWHSIIEPTETEGLLRVRMVVAWGAEDAAREVELSTCLAPGVLQINPPLPATDPFATGEAAGLGADPPVANG